MAEEWLTSVEVKPEILLKSKVNWIRVGQITVDPSNI